MSTFHEWYEKVFPELQGAGLWLRGGELNTLAPTEYERRDFRVLFVRLSTYFDTGYSFTHQLLYQVAAGTPGVFPDLGYLPTRQDAKIFARDGVPWLLGTQAKRGPQGYDLIGISNSIVQELLNLPAFLKKSGLPLAREERLARPELPLVILGGANALYSSAAWLDRGLVDGVFVGESDAALRRILEICRDGKRAARLKSETLELLEEVPGFFRPERPRSTRKSFIPNLNQSEALEAGPVYYLADQLGSSHLQISEGCPCFCSFCAESWDRKPYRERGAANLRETALRAKASMGLDAIDIYSFNFNMHSGLYQILWDLVEPFRNVGLKSQRFDLLAHDPMMVEFQHAIEKASITCGLEGISPRMRRYLHKNLENAELHRSLSAIFKSKARELKVFLIATGLEEQQDFEALGDFLDHLKEIRQNSDTSTRVIFSMTPLVRFPWTPLEFEDAPPVEHYASIIGRAGQRIRAGGFEFRESADLPEYWVSQILVRAADARVSAAIADTVEKTGFVYYREIPKTFMDELDRALRARGIESTDLLKGFDLEQSRTKPWAAIETGVKREFLWEEVERARQYKEIDYCLGRSWTKAQCFHCGGCPTRHHVRDIVLAEQKRGYTLEQFKERIAVARRTETVAWFRVKAGPAARGLPRKMLGVALARALMRCEPALAVSYRGYAGAYWDDGEREVWVSGDDAVALKFLGDGAERAGALARDARALVKINEELGAWATLLAPCDEHWRPGRIDVESPFALKADAYLKPRGLKHTLRRQSDGSYLYDLIAQSVKRGVLDRLVSIGVAGGGTHTTLAPGPKFNPREFATEAFVLPRPSDWVRTRFVSVIEEDARGSDRATPLDSARLR